MIDRSEEYRAIVDKYRFGRKLKRAPFISGDLAYMPLQTGNVSFTNAEYYEKINGCSWTEISAGYVVGDQNYDPLRRLQRWLWYHVNGEIPKGMCIDHINRNCLDNRLANLRAATLGENSRNRIVKNTTSKYPGVHFVATRQKYRAIITVNKLKYSVGMHKTEEEAFAAYYAKAVELGVAEYVPMKPKMVN